LSVTTREAATGKVLSAWDLKDAGITEQVQERMGVWPAQPPLGSPRPRPIQSRAYSPDGKLLALVGSGRAWLCEPATGRVVDGIAAFARHHGRRAAETTEREQSASVRKISSTFAEVFLIFA
jgi:hypothetical protein